MLRNDLLNSLERIKKQIANADSGSAPFIASLELIGSGFLDRDDLDWLIDTIEILLDKIVF